MRLKLAILIITIASIVTLFVIVKSDKRNSTQTEQLTFSLIKDKAFLKTVKSRSISEKEIILTEASKILVKKIQTVTDNKHKDFVLEDFNKVIPVIKFMLKIDPKNGHAIYFQGEIYRLMNDYATILNIFKSTWKQKSLLALTYPR